MAKPFPPRSSTPAQQAALTWWARRGGQLLPWAPGQPPVPWSDLLANPTNLSLPPRFVLQHFQGPQALMPALEDGELYCCRDNPNLWFTGMGLANVLVSPSPLGVIQVVNLSPTPAVPGDVGCVNSLTTGTYNTVAQQGTDVSWCVVVIGGAVGSTITVQRSGIARIKCDGNNSTSDWLLTSSLPGYASTNGAGPHYAMFANVVTPNIAGPGGFCMALLYTGTRYMPYLSVNKVFNTAAVSASTSAFISTISGAPSSTSVVYGVVSSGAANVIALNTNTGLGRLVLWNTTRGTGRIISSVNTGTSTITTVSTSDAWANGDTINITSTTVTGATPNMLDMDFSQQTEIPLTARAVSLRLSHEDSGTAGQRLGVHPPEAFNANKIQFVRTQVAGTFMDGYVTAVRMANYRFAIGWEGSGAGTSQPLILVTGYLEAVP